MSYGSMNAHTYEPICTSLLNSFLPTSYYHSADSDYRTLDRYATFHARSNLYSFNVEIYNDEEPEFTEEFYSGLTIAPEAESRGVHLVLPGTATVAIKDDDSE